MFAGSMQIGLQYLFALHQYCLHCINTACNANSIICYITSCTAHDKISQAIVFVLFK